MSDKNPYFDDAFKNFWYDEQLASYITQFMAVFSSMYVRIGKNDLNSQSNLIPIPIRYGGVDRVVEGIISGNTQNKNLRLPIFSVKLADVQLAPERAKGRGTTERKPFLPRGESLPDGIKIMQRRTPVPYKLFFELNVFTSNDLQKFQIMEQILSVFDPSIQIQTSDDPFDGGKISVLELESIGFEENYPSDTGKKVNVSSLIFSTVGWLQIPMNFKENFIKSIQLKLQAFDKEKDYSTAIENELENPESVDGYETIIDVDTMKDFPAS